MEFTEKFSSYASVLLDIAVDRLLEYGIPDNLSLKKGMRVEVPVKGKVQTGYVVDVYSTKTFESVQPIQSVVSDDIFIGEDLFQLAEWMSLYYATNLRIILQKMLPLSVRNNVSPKQQFYVTRKLSKNKLGSICKDLRGKHPSQAEILDVLLKTKKGIFLSELLEKSGTSRSPIQSLINKGYIHLESVSVNNSFIVNQDYFKTKAKKLNDEQHEALQKIIKTLSEKKFETHLLFGITGSGKTEIYLQAIEKALSENLGTIMLVPEISLTEQTIERFKARFDESLAILHHRLSNGEKYDEWHRIKRGEAKIVIGARSALFSPVQNLGLIIVDEEHDHAYKQTEQRPCYHARDVAVMRGKLTNSAVILGSATPSLESYYNALSGKYVLSKLSVRAQQASLPKIMIIDMKREYDKARGYTIFSEVLLDGIKKRLELGEQTLLFLNRRGYHSSLYCQKCYHIFKCPHCDLALTFHKSEKLLACHLCDYRLLPPPTRCPSCNIASTLKYKGIGTEQIQSALHALFPNIRSLRIDSDTTRHKGSHAKLLHTFSTGKADVLIGTQMITKGLHFPSVTLVAVLNGDSSLHIPDFRASEHLFQLITQVAGRSGRGELPGEVLIQTQKPDHTSIQQASKQDYEDFYNTEIEMRKMFFFPPYSHLIKVSFSGPSSQHTQEIANKIQMDCIQHLSKNDWIHPVVPSGYVKMQDRFRFQFLIRSNRIYAITSILKKISSIPRDIHMHIDIDPISTFF